MTTNYPKKIRSIADLQHERELLRGKISYQEEILRAHYSEFEDRFNPFLRFINFISGKKWFRDSRDDGRPGWAGMLFEILAAGAAGSALFGKSKKNLFQTLFAYGSEQVIRYIESKELTEHLEDIRSWIRKWKKKDGDETEEEMDETN